MRHPNLTFEQLGYVFSLMSRDANGCRPWRGTLNSGGVPVVKLRDRVTGADRQWTVRSLFDALLYQDDGAPSRRPCETEHCAHPRHTRARVSPLAS